MPSVNSCERIGLQIRIDELEVRIVRVVGDGTEVERRR